MIIHNQAAEIKPPDELKHLPQWVCHKAKEPKNPRTHNNASSTNPKTWGTLAEAQAALQTGQFDGLGIVLANGLAGVDLDHVRNPETGITEAWALDIIRDLDSYAEVSLSGTGVHILCFADNLPEGKRRKGKVEIYNEGRFFTFTGDHLPGTPETVNERTAALATVHTQWVAETPKPQTQTPPPAATSAELEDRLQAAFKASNGTKIQELFNGSNAGYDSPSEADAALCGLLAYYSDGDPVTLADLMLQSHRLRDKWSEKRGADTWLGSEVSKALARHSGGYWQPRRKHAPHASTEAADLKPDTWNRTELGNGERFAALHNHLARFNVTRGKWMIFNGQHWQEDNRGEAVSLAKNTVRGLYAEAAAIEDDDDRKSLLKFAFGCEKERSLLAMLNLAKTCEGMTLLETDFDSDGWRLNVNNGEVNLKTGELLPHSPDSLCAKLAPVNYNPQATCEKWLSFLNEIFAGNTDIIQFLQRAVGASLTGTMRDQVLFILHGSGANGKTTFINTITKLLGDYATGCEAQTLMAGNYGTRNDIADLAGARFVAAAESGEDSRLDESVIKRLTGGDRIKARFLFREHFEFDPTFHIWLATNHKPRIRGTDFAIWRRIRLIPFNVTIPDNKQNPDLINELAKELSGILNWAITGCLQWQQDGLQAPAEVMAATASYRNDSDVVGRFIEACCITQDGIYTTASDLRAAFETWAESEGERMTWQAAGRRLTDRGIDAEQLPSGARIRRGIGLLAAEQN